MNGDKATFWEPKNTEEYRVCMISLIDIWLFVLNSHRIHLKSIISIAKTLNLNNVLRHQSIQQLWTGNHSHCFIWNQFYPNTFKYHRSFEKVCTTALIHTFFEWRMPSVWSIGWYSHGSIKYFPGHKWPTLIKSQHLFF